MRTTSVWIRIIALWVSLAGVVQADYYRWTDENGVTHFADTPATLNSQAVDFRAPTVIPMNDNNQQRGDRLQSLKPKAPRGSSQQRPVKKAPKKAAAKKDQIARQKICQNYEDRIDHIDSRLRAGGYSIATGNRLRRQRREVSSTRSWECLRR